MPKFRSVMRPVHPGEFLLEDYMKPLGLSESMLAKRLGVSTSRIRGIIRARRRITTDTALRLEHFFGSDALGWLNLQCAYDLHELESNVGTLIKNDVTPIARV